MKKWIIPAVCTIGLCVLGCQALLDRITPAEIPPNAVSFTGNDPNDYWPTLHSAKRLKTDVINTHRDNLLGFQRLIEDNKNEFGDMMDLVIPAIEESTELQAIAVGTEAQPGILWSLLLGGSGLYVGGRFIKRPEEKELEKKANGE